MVLNSLWQLITTPTVLGIEPCVCKMHAVLGGVNGHSLGSVVKAFLVGKHPRQYQVCLIVLKTVIMLCVVDQYEQLVCYVHVGNDGQLSQDIVGIHTYTTAQKLMVGMHGGQMWSYASQEGLRARGIC